MARKDEEEYIEGRTKFHNLETHTKIALAIMVAAIGLAIMSALGGCATVRPVEAPHLVERHHHTARARITYYTGHHERVAMGGRAKVNHTAAAHPKYPFKTKVEIPELFKYLGESEFEIQDRGRAVTSRKASHGKTDVFDIYVKNYSTMKRLEKEASEYMDVQVYEPESPRKKM